MLLGFQLAQFQSYRQVGRFLSLDLLTDAVKWGVDNPELIRPYLSLDWLLRWKVLAAVAIAAAIGIAARQTVRCGRENLSRWAPLPAAVPVSCIALLTLTAVAWMPWMPPTRYHSASLWMAGAAFFESGHEDAAPFFELSSTELRARYRQMASAPPPRSSPAHWAAARDYDVLLFVFETGPAQCVAADGNLDALPNLRSLRERSWVASRHHTTYPVTNRAMFSILSSMYPSTGARLFRDSSRAIPGLLHSVGAAGYETALYMPSSISFAHERSMYRMLGAQTVSIASSDAHPAAHTQEGWRAKESLDLLALANLERDMSGWISAGQRFAAVYLPQIGHGPWVDVSRGGEERDLLRRGRNLMILQDAWLGRLMAVLKRQHRLDHTLIVVTADHGVRSREEDPSFQGGIDEYTFRVPFLLYAPGILASRTDIPWVTSHIDVTPSLLDLLGIREGREWEEGSALWDSRLASRTTLFLAKEYLGADGWHSQGGFFSWNSFAGLAYRSDQLRFAPPGIVRSEDPRAAQMRAFDRSVSAFQYAWYNRAIQSHSGTGRQIPDSRIAVQVPARGPENSL